MFSQTSCHPQVLAAVGQLTTAVSTVRQGLLGSVHTHRAVRNKRQKSATQVSTEQEKLESSASATPTQQERELQELFVVDVTRELEALNKSLQLTDKSFCSIWRQSDISCKTFFENKTGFPEESLTLPPSPSEINALFRNQHVRRLLENQSKFLYTEFSRGFKTRAGARRSGLGKSSSGSSMEDAFDEFNSKLQALNPLHRPKSSAESAPLKKGDVGDDVFAAFTKGYTEGREYSQSNTKKFKLGAIKTLLTISLVLWVLSNLLGQNRSELGKMMTAGQDAVNAELVNVVFDDVRGVDEAKQELIDVVEYLRNPGKFTSVGAVLPKGVLLVGPPGIGKTMLAKAVAGEAGVPFFYASGSEFDEIFVGSGARKVRNLFASAKAKAPCVVFLDEIDSVGGKRTSSVMHPYANQTINQLLAELDGFNSKEGVIVLGATNRRDNLDKALLRPGRFDVEVQVMPPDYKGRVEIFKLYLGRVKTDSSVNAEVLARGTSGFTGADIQNMVNQAALRAGQEGMSHITMEHMEYARDKIQMGPAWKNKVISMDTKWNTAYHEAGHTVVAYFTKETPPLRKVTILPRGPSLGHTSFSQHEDKEHSQTKAMLLGQIDLAMGGRLGEELIFGPGNITTGAYSDFKGATELATNMVKSFGMSEKVGVRVYGGLDDKELSAATKELIDSEIKRLLDESYERAKQILISHSTEHKLLAQALIEYETLDKEEVEQIMKTKKPFKKAVVKPKEES